MCLVQEKKKIQTNDPLGMTLGCSQKKKRKGKMMQNDNIKAERNLCLETYYG
jgi:hypothetical protein